MSVYATAYVWEHSTRKGTELLLLLAIADIAHRNGVAFPSVKTLARYIRMSERNTQRAIQALERSGELSVKRAAGPKGTHLFQIRMNQTLPLFWEGGDKLSGDKLSGDTQGQMGVTPSAKRGDTALSPEPPRTKDITREARKRALPDGFGISDGVRAWARAKGWERFLQAHLEHFLGHVKANGSRYIDWDHAFQNCIRADWGGVRRPATGGRVEPVKADPKCDYCSTPLLTRGWTQAPKGKACDDCRREYMERGAYPSDRQPERAAA